MKTILKKDRVLPVLLLLGAAGLSFIIPLALQYHQNKTELLKNAREEAGREVRTAASRIDEDLRRVMPLVQQLAKDLGSGKLDDTGLHKRIKQVYDGCHGLLEVGAAFVPSLRGDKPYAPHYGIKNGETKFFQVEDFYNYREEDWYKSTLKNGAQWFEPYFGRATRTLVTGYCVLFYRLNAEGKQVISGMVRANISLTTANRLLLEQQLGKTGYGFLISRKGAIIAHPEPEYVSGSETLDGLSDKKKVPPPLRLSTALSKSKSGVIDLVHPSTGQKTWLFYENIPSSQWTLAANVIRTEWLQKHIIDARHSRAILLNGYLLLTILVTLFTGRYIALRKGKSGEWVISITCSVILVVGIGLLWGTFGNYSRFESDTVLVDRDGIARVVSDLDRLAQKHNVPPPLHIHTGVYIQSLEFTSANNVTISGYLWQKYHRKKHAGIQQGFIFPESVSSVLSEPYREQTGDRELVRWYFESVLRQPFDYGLYPFDHKNVWVRIWHKEFYKSILLIPDLASYHLVNPVDCPGVESGSDFVLNGWSLVDTYFEYKTNRYNSSFGKELETGKPRLPELYFVINLQRNFIDAFITNLVPLMVVLFMLLATLITITHNREKSSKFGSNPFAILSACSALFFIVVIAHIQLRGQFAVPEIMYLEYFYFVMYLAILWVSISAFLIVSDVPIYFIQYKDGLLPKVFFLPVILVSLYIITFLVFY